MRFALYSALSILTLSGTNHGCAATSIQYQEGQLMAQLEAQTESKGKSKSVEIIGPPRKERPGAIIGRDGQKIPLEKEKFSSVFDKLGRDTI